MGRRLFAGGPAGYAARVGADRSGRPVTAAPPEAVRHLADFLDRFLAQGGDADAALASCLRHRLEADAYLEEGRRRRAAGRAGSEAWFDPAGSAPDRAAGPPEPPGDARSHR